MKRSPHNVVNVKIEPGEEDEIAAVRDYFEKGFRYTCDVKNFEDWRQGPYKVLTISKDGTGAFRVPVRVPDKTEKKIGTNRIPCE